MELLLVFIAANTAAGVWTHRRGRLPPAWLLVGAVLAVAFTYTGQRFL